MTQLEQDIFQIKNNQDFEEIVFSVFDFQVKNNPVYQKFVKLIGKNNPKKIEDIPFLPIEFFKTHKVTCGEFYPETIFKSSGTGGQRSTHYVKSLHLYEKSFLSHYIQSIGHPENQVIIALLPNYIEQGNSSLVYMVNHLIQKSLNPLSGFLLNQPEQIIQRYEKALQQGKNVIIFGVSYALLDLCESNINLPAATIIETGGMKGRRKELTKEELHQQLKAGLNPKKILSEYGMTELLSQAYSNEDMLFQFPNTMKFFIREANDPFSYLSENKTGAINIIDLANIYSCSFIATQDLGKNVNGKLMLSGRLDHADIRGCNLLVQ